MNAKKKRLSRGALLVLLLAALIVALLGVGWIRCGLGRSSGESDTSGDTNQVQSVAEVPSSALADAAPSACLLRINSAGSTVYAGEVLDRASAVKRCRGARDVVLDVAGDAPFGAVEDLRRALEAAGLSVRDR